MTTDWIPPTFATQSEASLPETLYHYTGQTGLLGIVERGELWCTKVQYMNDATEFGLALEMARTALDKMIEMIPGDASETARRVACMNFRRSLDGLEGINLFATCFCENGDLLSQWRGYGGGSQGYSIGFDTEILKNAVAPHGFRLGQCIYDAGSQRKIVDEAIVHCLEDKLAVPPRSQWGGHGPLANLLFKYGAFFKDGSFSEEREWRLVSSTVDFRDDKITFRPGRSMITPYYNLPIRKDGELPIRGVIVGPCPHMELSKAAITSVLMAHGLRGPLNGQQIAFGSQIPFRDW
jgi:Protein of unknown function (DUF2971)